MTFERNNNKSWLFELTIFVNRAYSTRNLQVFSHTFLEAMTEGMWSNLVSEIPFCLMSWKTHEN